MTAIPDDLPSMPLASPAAAIAAIPSLLGFAPTSSLVLLWVRDGSLALTQRIDLPDGPTAPVAWLDACVVHAGAPAARQALAVVFAPRGRADALPAARAIDQLEARLAEEGVDLLDALLADGDRWFSYRCDGACCPREGRVLEPALRDRIAATFALEGVASFPDRASVVASMARDDDAERAMRRRLPREPRVWTERARSSVLAGPLRAVLDGTELAPAQAARVLAGLVDIRVRDTMLWRLSRRDDPRIALSGLIGVLRAAPDGYVAPVATVTAIAAWLAGDGARAVIALDRALADDPRHSLALLVEAALRAGLPPTAWRSAMAELDERACRTGA